MKALLEDTIKTTVPLSALEDIMGYVAEHPDVAEALKEQTEFDDPVETMKQGYKSKDKNSKEFKDFIRACDPAGVLAYEDGLVQILFDDVADVHKTAAESGIDIFVYSAQSKERSIKGYQSNGQDKYIKAYFSSGDKPFKDKYSGEAYQKIAEELGIGIQELIYVTDDVKEAQGAVKAGVGKVMLIDRNAKELGEKDGYEIADHFSKVLEYIKEENDGNL